MDKTTNFKKEMCRVCFSSDSPLESLYSLINFDTLTKLKSFIEIDEEEPPKSKLPNRICQKCIPTLKIAFDFKSLCEENDLILKKKFCDNFMEIKVEPFTDKIEEIDVSKVKREYSDDDEDWDMEIEVVKKDTRKPEKKKDEYIIFCEKCHRIFDNKTALRRHKGKCDGKGEESETTEDEDDGEVVGWDTQSVRDDDDEEEDQVDEPEVEAEEEEDDDDEHEDEDNEQEEETHNEPKVKVNVLNNGNQLECEKCNRTFKNKSGLGKHRAKCFRPGETADDKALKCYDCEVCKKVFQTFHALKFHLKKSHDGEPSEKNIENYKLERVEINARNALSASKCDICSKSFASPAILSRHTKTKHETCKFVCDVCNNGFYTQHLLNKHKMLHTTERNFPCDACTKAFKTPEHLRKHQKTHMSLEDRNINEKVKKYLCISCGKILYTHTGYQTHLKIHTGEKDFNCEICGKSFRVKSRLIKHQVIHIPDRPFQCNYCEMNFKDKLLLKEHKKSHNIEKKFFCDICGVSMRHKESLKHHVRNIHMGIRDHKCDLCGEGFYTSNWLKKHKANKH